MEEAERLLRSPGPELGGSGGRGEAAAAAGGEDGGAGGRAVEEGRWPRRWHQRCRSLRRNYAGPRTNVRQGTTSRAAWVNGGPGADHCCDRPSSPKGAPGACEGCRADEEGTAGDVGAMPAIELTGPAGRRN